MSIYTFRKGEASLHVQFLTDEIVRFFYGDKIGKNITDSVILKPGKANDWQDGNSLRTPKIEVRIDKNLLVKILDSKGKLITEDVKIRFGGKDISEKQLGWLDGFEKDLSGKKVETSVAITVEKKYNGEKGFYGLGEKYCQINRLDNYTENWNTDILGIGPIHHPAQKAYHTSIPFYIGLKPDRAYGIMYDNSFRNSFDFARYSKNIVFKAFGGTLDYYFIYGETLPDIVENYSKLTGMMPLPRKEYLGYQQCRWSYMSCEEMLDVAQKLREHKVPADVMYFDINYMKDYKVFTIDSENYKNFKDMTAKLHKMGFKLVVIIDPGVKREPGYHVYDEGIKSDYFIKDKYGIVYVGKVWPGDSVFADFLRADVRHWWGSLHGYLFDEGVDGIWNDMNEISDMSMPTKTLPEDTYHVDDDGVKRTQAEIHNVYAHYESKSAYEGMIALRKNERPFLLTRSASAGTQRYTAIWTGDNSSVWEHLEASISNLLNLGLSGFSFAGSDIGGFVEDGKGELLARWMQLGAFYPLCRNHSIINSLRQEPWSFGKEVLDISRKFLELRYSLIDYIYNLFHVSSVKGYPVIRPLFFRYQDDEKTYNITDQFMLGDDFIVAPVMKPKTDMRMIYLPEGTWIDYFSGERYEGKQYILKQAKLDELPLFVREGAIVLKNLPMQYIDVTKKQDYEVHFYGLKNGEADYYFDDGHTFNYRGGKYSIVNIKVSNGRIVLTQKEKGYPVGGFTCVIHSDSGMKKIEDVKIGKPYEV